LNKSRDIQTIGL